MTRYAQLQINDLTEATGSGELLTTQVTNETFAGVPPCVVTKRLTRREHLVATRALIQLRLCTQAHSCHCFD